MDFDTADMVSFDTKYILLSTAISLVTTLLMTCFVANGKNLKYSKVLLYIYLFLILDHYDVLTLKFCNWNLFCLTGKILAQEWWTTEFVNLIGLFILFLSALLFVIFYYDFVINKFSPLFLFSNLPNPSLYNDKELLRSLKIETFCAIILVVKKFNFLT